MKLGSRILDPDRLPCRACWDLLTWEQARGHLGSPGEGAERLWPRLGGPPGRVEWMGGTSPCRGYTKGQVPAHNVGPAQPPRASVTQPCLPPTTWPALSWLPLWPEGRSGVGRGARRLEVGAGLERQPLGLTLESRLRDVPPPAHHQGLSAAGGCSGSSGPPPCPGSPRPFSSARQGPGGGFAGLQEGLRVCGGPSPLPATALVEGLQVCGGLSPLPAAALVEGLWVCGAAWAVLSSPSQCVVYLKCTRLEGLLTNCACVYTCVTSVQVTTRNVPGLASGPRTPALHPYSGLDHQAHCLFLNIRSTSPHSLDARCPASRRLLLGCSGASACWCVRALVPRRGKARHHH